MVTFGAYAKYAVCEEQNVPYMISKLCNEISSYIENECIV